MDDKSQVVGEEVTLPLEVSNKHLDTILTEKGTSHHKLLLDPKGYATKAIQVLEEQLTNARTENRRNKLRHRIENWKKTLEVLGD